MLKLLVLIIGLIFTFSSTANDCRDRWDLKTGEVTIDWNENRYLLPIYIKISHKLQNCGVSAVLLKTNSDGSLDFSSGNNVLRGNIVSYRSTRVLSYGNQGTVVALDRSGRTTVWVVIQNATFADSGRYVGNLRSELVGFRKLEKKRDRLQFNVSPYVHLSVNKKGVNSAETVNLGDISKAQSKRVWLDVYANTYVEVNFQSKYGALKNSNHSSATIPYQLLFNKSPTDWNQNYPVRNSRGVSKNELTIKVVGSHGALAGEYTDTITITATARP